MNVFEYFRVAMWVAASATILVSIGLAGALAYDWSFSTNRNTAKISLGIFILVQFILIVILVSAIPEAV